MTSTSSPSPVVAAGPAPTPGSGAALLTPALSAPVLTIVASGDICAEDGTCGPSPAAGGQPFGG